MSHWSDPIDIDFPELFSSVDREGFPELSEGDEGLTLHADNLKYEDGVFSCNLLLSFAFSREFLSSFRRVGSAINILIENVDTGQCYKMNLDDPHKTYPIIAGDNFDPAIQTAPPGLKTSYREIPLTMVIENPGWGPHLFCRAVLQNHTSNIVALDVSDKVSIFCFVNGTPHSPSLSKEDSDSDA